MLVTAQLCVALLVTPTHHASGLARTSRLRRLAPVLVQKPPQLVPELTEANTTLLRLNDMVAAEDRPSPLLILWRFSRPHTIIGSAMCIPALMLYTAPVGAPLGPLVLAMLYAIPPSLLMNLYIVGVNQLTDIDLDKVNKPQLPLAAGVLSPAAGVGIVVIALFTSLALSCHPWLSSGPLRVTLIGSALLGTCYSLPPFRLKRYPLLAALSIMSVRGALINWGFCAHASAILSRVRTSVEGSSSVMAAAGGAAAAGMPLRCFAPIAFFVIFGTVCARTCDVLICDCVTAHVCERMDGAICMISPSPSPHSCLHPRPHPFTLTLALTPSPSPSPSPFTLTLPGDRPRQGCA